MMYSAFHYSTGYVSVWTMTYLIDGHAHVVHGVSGSHMREASQLFPEDMHFPAESLLQGMCANEIDVTVLYPTSRSDKYAQLVQRCLPDRTRVLPIIRSTRDIQEQFQRYSISGVRAVGESVPMKLLTDHSALDFLCEKSLVLSLFTSASNHEAITRAARNVPELAILINHCGLKPQAFDRVGGSRPRLDPPTEAEMVSTLSLAASPNIRMCISALYAFSNQPFPYEDLAPYAKMLTEAFGYERLIWGSDLPFTASDPGIARIIEGTKALLGPASGSAVDAVLGNNAWDLFPYRSAILDLDDVIITEESPNQPRVLELFEEADRYYASLYPDESNHPIFMEGLVAAGSTFLVARSRSNLEIVGTGALVPLGTKGYFEVKRMYTQPEFRRRGVGRAILERLLNFSSQHAPATLRLETGYLQPEAISLYLSVGFREIPAFSPYSPDSNSRFMEKILYA